MFIISSFRLLFARILTGIALHVPCLTHNKVILNSLLLHVRGHIVSRDMYYSIQHDCYKYLQTYKSG
jgi:uncharacterized protein YuzB (UPF0349 family)